MKNILHINFYLLIEIVISPCGEQENTKWVRTITLDPEDDH